MKIEDLIYLLKMSEPKMLEKIYFSKVIYLIEWKYILLNNKPLLDIEFENNNSGPTFDNYLKYFEDIPNINSFTENFSHIPEVHDIIFYLFEKTERLEYTSFVNLVFSTYPFITSNKYDILNLVQCAKNYKEILNKEELSKIENLDIKRKSNFLKKVKKIFQ